MIELTSYVISPVAITPAMLTSCTVPEPAAGETVWVSGTTYAIGDVCIRVETHKMYKRVTAGAGTTAPESDTANWLDIGYTNRWKQFDRKIGTATTFAGSQTTTLQPGSVEGLALLELVGNSVTVTIKDTPGGTVVYNTTQSLDNTVVTDVYDWMYANYQQRRNMVLTDLPGQYPSCELSVTINATTSSAVGVLACGRTHPIGAAEYGSGAGIINFGKVTDDGFGNREWLEGDWANRVTYQLVCERYDFNRIHSLLAGLRSTPVVYIATDLQAFESMITYGVYRDLYMTVSNYALVNFNLEIDGLNNI